MNPVIGALREHIADQNVCFIFPSQVASDLWAQKTCTLGIVRSVAKNRFLAWDRFKEEGIREKETKKKPVTSVMRKLFADYLLQKNAGAPFLKSLVPIEYAMGGKVFTASFAKLLPSLCRWEKLMKNSGSKDEEDRDYELIKKEYIVFLDHHDLFEPSWEEIKIRDQSTSYVIFFPELIEDFTEYDALLSPPQFIRVGTEAIHAAGGHSVSGETCFLFQSAREEIRSAVMEMQRLHNEEKIPYREMAVSVPELEEMEPWLLREFSLRNIPFTRRAGRKLGETGAGRLFSLVSECASSGFSFNSIKALVLNDHIPWEEKEKNSSLVNFGIKYNCVSSYCQDGKTVDIWEEAFRGARNDGGAELGLYYRELKKRIRALAEAKNFFEIRKYYFAFRGSLLDMGKISETDDAVLSRCIEELASLIALEETLGDPSLIPSSPFAFFISCLNDKEYVRANQTPGVNVFKWRVAAASPFSCHFVLNASQSAASVLYQPMKFLRQDKRKNLGLDDMDASASFFLLCNTGKDESYECRTRISVSSQTFSGPAIPHSFFAGGRTVPAGNDPSRSAEDPYVTERRFFRELGKDRPAGGGVILKNIFSAQKSSFESWKSNLSQNENNFSFSVSPFPVGAGFSVYEAVRKFLKEAILDKEGCLVVTPTRDLNVYYKCPLFWLYSEVFKAEVFSLEAALLDDRLLGILYHKILEKLFRRIKDEDAVFNSRRLDIYKTWTKEITKTAIKEDPAFKGPLALPLVSPQAAGISKKIIRLLELEAKFFNGFTIKELEYPVSLKTEGLLITGIIDRVSISPEGKPVIIDYKSASLPDQTELEDINEKHLLEFQMPLYIKLYEENKKDGIDPRVGSAFFYSINKRKIKSVMGKITGGRSKVPDREEYEPFIKAAECQIEEFARKARALDFIPPEIRFKDCTACAYKTVCRSVYYKGEPD